MYTTSQRSIIALRESFLSILPYIVIISMSVLFMQVSHFLDFDIVNFSSYFINVYPFILYISMNYHFSIRHNVDFIISFLISTSIVLFLYLLFFESQLDQIFNSTITLFMFIVPIGTVLSLRYYHTVPLSILFSSNDVKGIWNLFITYAKVFIVWMLIYSFLYLSLSYLWGKYHIELPSQSLLLIRTFFVQIFWFFGIHGGNLHAMIADTSFLEEIFVSNLSYLELLRFFVILGGSGMMISLISAILLFSKEKHSRNIAKISMPFSLFNIGEVILFGLPVMLNKYLLLPFILIPIINILILYYLLPLYPIEIYHHGLSWSTPMFFNIYYATDGDWRAVAMQAGIFLLDIVLYTPFVIRYSNVQSTDKHHAILEDTLGIKHALNEKKGIELYSSIQSSIDANIKLESTINILENNVLQIYLQPIIDIQNHKTAYYEALLRLKLKDGKIEGPYFLEDIEVSGLASIIDIWVCTEVNKHIESTIGSKIQININIHPDTLSDTEAIQKIITILDKKNIAFEIIEKRLLENEKALVNINLLKEHGFKIYIDDIGDGYSSYMMLCTLPINAIKIDKSLIDILNTDKGYKVISHLFSLSKSLGYECIVEGIETESQLKNIKQIGIKYVQGFYFAPALSISEALTFTVKK